MRDVFVDRLKGYACFLVVFGHVIMGVRLSGTYIPREFFFAEKFIWSFHVALFLFLSGYVYKITNEWKSKGTRLEFIGYKFVNLGVPYTFFSVLYIAINSFAASANTNYMLTDVLYIWKTPVAQYWFLYALFFLFVIWAALSKLLGNLQITVLVTALSFLLGYADIKAETLLMIFASGLPFGLGTVCGIGCLKRLDCKIKAAIIACHAAAAAALIKFNLISAPGIKECMCVFGICASIVFVSAAEKNKSAAKFLAFMNRYSFQIYLLHTIFTAGIRIVLIRFGIVNWLIHVVLGCAGGIAFSVAAAYIAAKVRFLNILFFPSK